jgi:hypothetical protein
MTGEDKCFWSAETNECLKTTISITALSEFYVAAISAILSIPFVMVQEFIFSRYLDAPDEDGRSTQAIVNAQLPDVIGASKLEYAALLTELDRFRSSLDDDSKASLDEMWSNASPWSDYTMSFLRLYADSESFIMR